MTKRERLEDLGILTCLLNDILEDDIFTCVNSKHGFEYWKERVHDKVEYGEVNGLEGIYTSLRFLKERIEKCQAVAQGDVDDD